MGKYIVHKPVNADAVIVKNRQAIAYYEANYLMQPKYDGCNTIVKCFKNGEFDVRSRTNEVVHSCDHFAAILDNDQYAQISGSESGLVYLGEAWHPKWDQSTISGSSRRHSPDTELEFMVFDVLTVEEFDAGYSPVPYRERLKRYHCGGGGDQRVRQVLTIPQGCVSVETMQVELDMTGGYDGIILADPNGTWTAGSGTTGEKIKVKPLATYDLEIVGFKEGLGKDKGTVGALEFKWRDGKTVWARGGDTQEKTAWFNDPSLIVGKIGEVEAMKELTSGGLLREPRFKGLRFDKVSADI